MKKNQRTGVAVSVELLLIAATIGMLLVPCTASAAPIKMVLVKDARPNATIVVGTPVQPAANLAALELQYHVRRITGAQLPIAAATEPVEGVRILVGESAATRALGLAGQDFPPDEYLIRFLPETIVLMGRDWQDTPENRAVQGRGTSSWHMTLDDWRQEIDYGLATGAGGDSKRIELPGIYDDQGTCYAAYDFLERFCGVRWYGPSELNVVLPHTETLKVSGAEVRRAPALKHRDGGGGGWPIVKAQWDEPTADQLTLYWRRMRRGGERWAGNHSFTGFQDRFLAKNPDRPEVFEESRPDFFAKGREGGAGHRQLCYTNPDLARQIAQDARDFFDGKGLKYGQLAMGDYFAVVPLDNNQWCMCESCQAILEADRSRKLDTHFNNGTASDYLFGFVNAVAKELAPTHPDKYIATLAYHVYAYPPEDFELEPNVAVAPCLQPRNYWGPKLKAHDRFFYKQWVQQDRPIHLWNYYCFPMEPAVISGWNCFPGFSAHTLAEQIQMYHRDGVRGVFLCGIGEQVDYYVTMKFYDDPTQDIDALLHEFFSLYFGAAAKPMARFYGLIEETFGDSDLYPAPVRTKEHQFHQTERMAWKYLGTSERMERLGKLIAKAERAAKTDIEKKRVQTWKEGVWDYMAQGRKAYIEKTAKSD